MAKDESDKDKPALEQLREHLLAQELDDLAAKKKRERWESPSEDEFNEWITPLDALDVSDSRMADDHQKWEIVEKLRAGQILAVARTGQMRGDLVGVQPFVPVHGGTWSRMDQTAEHYFWKTGHLVVPEVRSGILTGGKERYFDIRFDPASFSGRPPPNLPEEPSAPSVDWTKLAASQQPASVAAQPVDSQPPPARDKRPNLTAPEAEKFCKLLLDGWPATTEREAHRRAAGFFHEKKVPMHWFWGIFRSIRGHRNPGPQPKTKK